MNSVKICGIVYIFLNKPLTWLQSKAQPSLSQYNHYMICCIASEKSEIPLSGLGKPKSDLLSGPLPINYMS